MKVEDTKKAYAKQYIQNLFKLIFLASISISLAVIVTGVLGYKNTESSLINKAKSQDIIFIVKSMGAMIDSRINRAVETSHIFARDPLNIQWVQGEEKDEELGKAVIEKMRDIANEYDYSNLFITGVKTRGYHIVERYLNGFGNEKSVTLSQNNLEDKWFFDALKLKKEVVLNVDYEKVLDDHFLFVNTSMGDVNNPVGICGVGLSLNDISNEFRKFKVGEKSSLWMIDEKGIIQLSDTREDVGKSYEEFLTADVINQIHKESTETVKDVKVSEYVDKNKDTIDYAYYKLNSTDWILLYKIPREENLSLLASLKTNMMITVGIILFCFIILFYAVSKKIADPYKQAMLINKELEDKVNIRTQELTEANKKVMDSIEYAKRLQESIFPREQDIKNAFKDNFLIWRPKDTVGGDFYWLREIDNMTVLAVGDCTGHGVPGAFMTMTVNAILNNIVTDANSCEPSFILKELHSQLKQALNKASDSNSLDDGLDIAIFCLRNINELLFVGANIELWVKNNGEIKVYKPQCKGIGYNYIDLKDYIESILIEVHSEDIFIVTTDGFLHQNGGEKNYPFGKKRLVDVLKECENGELAFMKARLEEALKIYMGTEIQRDDITLFGFKAK